MAQVTMSGEAGFAYISDKKVVAGTAATNGVGKAQATTKGMAQTDGSITIAATDDLGGGMKLSVAHTVDLKGRSSVTAENSTMSLSGSFGSILIGALNAGNGIIGKGSAGGVGRGMDGTIVDGDTPVDLIQYTSPELITGLTAFANAADVGAAGAGEGSFQAAGVGINYSTGPLSVTFDSTSYSGHAVAAAVTARAATCTDATSGAIGTAVAYGTACATGSVMLTPGVAVKTAATVLATQIDSRQRLSFTYDLGMAKIGYGTQTKSYAGTGVDNKQTVLGVSAPIGAFTVSLARATNKADGAATETTGTDLGINYALSKRTALNFSSMKSKTTGSVSDTYTRLRLKTTF
jgi:hypothetical protein